MNADLDRELDEAAAKAWDSLARYKFVMFGYHAAQWVYLNRVCRLGLPNPFRDLVMFARARPGARFPGRSADIEREAV